MQTVTRRSALAAAMLTPVGLLRARSADAQESGVGNFGPAPEFTGISAWLNSPPLTMAQLRGKVVLIDFWTYSCINCLRTLPYVTRWYDTYRDKGFVVVGVHTPEFAFERITANVQTAIGRFGIKYPVAQDNAMATWRAYSNQIWPSEYLVNQSGEIVLRHFGEGRYDETENAIRSLLSAGPKVAGDNGVDLSRIRSPEMYFGSSRVEMLANPATHGPGTTTYTMPDLLPPNHFALAGSWALSPEFATLEADGGGVALAFQSGKVFMVASSPQPVTLGVTVDGKPQPPVTVHESRLYTLYDSTNYATHIMSISIPKAGLQAFTFTFG